MFTQTDRNGENMPPGFFLSDSGKIEICWGPTNLKLEKEGSAAFGY